MEPSIFEKMSDRVIFSISKEIVNEVDVDTVENSADWMFYQAVESVCKMYSIDPSIQDTDFLFNIIKLNESMFDEGSLTSKLDRPTLKNYEYDWVVTMKTIVNEYYRNTISLYTDKDDVNSVLYSLKSEGTLDVFDGDLFEEDTRDSEMLDDELDNVSQI
jgi:hypothetical protein